MRLEHGQLCATRSIVVSLGFVAFCGWMVLLSWREFKDHQPFVDDPTRTLTQIVGIAGAVGLYGFFKCRRERFVVALVIVRLGLEFLAGHITDVANAAVSLLRGGFVALWVIAAAVSISMLISASRAPSQTGKTGTV